MRPSSYLKALHADSDVAQDDNWMLSYIDVFVLITTLFLMLLVMNNASFGTVNAPREGIQEALATSEVSVMEEQAFVEQLIAPKPSQEDTELFSTLQSSIITHGMQSHIQLVQEADRTRLEIQSRVLFNSGDAYLTRSGEALLDKILPILEPTQGIIVIEGHTDNNPIKTKQFPSNWSLAASRATEVLEFFVAEGFDQSRFRAVSYGDTQPIVPNDSSANRRSNRRVSLVIEQAL